MIVTSKHRPTTKLPVSRHVTHVYTTQYRVIDVDGTEYTTDYCRPTKSTILGRPILTTNCTS